MIFKSMHLFSDMPTRYTRQWMVLFEASTIYAPLDHGECVQKICVQYVCRGSVKQEIQKSATYVMPMQIL
jgi:hypothetical protein